MGQWGFSNEWITHNRTVYWMTISSTALVIKEKEKTLADSVSASLCILMGLCVWAVKFMKLYDLLFMCHVMERKSELLQKTLKGDLSTVLIQTCHISLNQRKWIMYFIEWQEQPPKRDQFIPHMHRLKTDTLTVICLWTAHCVVTFLVKSQAHGVKKGRGQVSQSMIEVSDCCLLWSSYIMQAWQ